MKYHEADISNSTFLITGGAGFIGSNLVRYLVENGAGKVRILDNLSNGYKENIEQYLDLPNVEFMEESIEDFSVCQRAVEGVDYIMHQAALGSVPRSINDPIKSNFANVNGFLHMLTAAKDANIKRMVYASSSSVYGDNEVFPRIEHEIGNPLSPYAVTKQVDELYGRVFNKIYGLPVIGLRYFNVFGPNQSPNGPYAAVIPRFMEALLGGKQPVIFGDGGQSRDFTYVENVIQANIKCLFNSEEEALGEVLNVSLGNTISINQIYEDIRSILEMNVYPKYEDERQGDVRDSMADIGKAQRLIGFDPTISVADGLKITIKWFQQKYFPEVSIP